ncbi:type II toxin-antitoxin system Phd/YefM family antitoxin [Bacteroidota bacterium]
MNSYTKEEIISSSKLSKNLGSVLSSLRYKKLRKVVVIRNNELEAVILPIDEYERISEMAEHIEIAQTISQRAVTPVEDSISFEDILKENGIDEKDL